MSFSNKVQQVTTTLVAKDILLVQPFLQGSPMCLAERQTDTHTDPETLVTIGCKRLQEKRYGFFGDYAAFSQITVISYLPI